MSITGFYLNSFSGLSSTGTYYSQIVDSIGPTATFLYDNLLTNSIFYGIIITCLVVSFFSFGSD